MTACREQKHTNHYPPTPLGGGSAIYGTRIDNASGPSRGPEDRIIAVLDRRIAPPDPEEIIMPPSRMAAQRKQGLVGDLPRLAPKQAEVRTGLERFLARQEARTRLLDAAA